MGPALGTAAITTRSRLPAGLPAALSARLSAAIRAAFGRLRTAAAIRPAQPPGGYYPPPDYRGGWGPGQPVSRPGTNGLAIASLVTAFTGFLCCIGSIVAIVLGTIALDQIKRTRQEGFGLAVAGIVLGVAGLVVALIIWIFAMHLR